MINDVSRAFFEAPIGRKVCIELPEEDLEEGWRVQGVGCTCNAGKWDEGIWCRKPNDLLFKEDLVAAAQSMGCRMLTFATRSWLCNR